MRLDKERMYGLLLAVFLMAIVVGLSFAIDGIIKDKNKKLTCQEEATQLVESYKLSSLGWRTAEDERNAKFATYFMIKDLEKRCT